MKSILVIIACAVAGYVVVMLLMNTKADDLRPPGDRDDPPPRDPTPEKPPEVRRLPSPPSSMPGPTSRKPGSDWTLLLDLPRSASTRDIEAAFRRQQSKAEAVGDRDLLDRLRAARDAALAEKKA